MLSHCAAAVLELGAAANSTFDRSENAAAFPGAVAKKQVEQSLTLHKLCDPYEHSFRNFSQPCPPTSLNRQQGHMSHTYSVIARTHVPLSPCNFGLH